MKPYNEVILERFGLAGKDYKSKLGKYYNYSFKQLDDAICKYHFKANDFGGWAITLIWPVAIGSVAVCGIAGTFFGLPGNFLVNAFAPMAIIESVPLVAMRYCQLKENKFCRLRNYKHKQQIIERYKE